MKNDAVNSENIVETKPENKQSVKDKMMADGKMSVLEVILAVRYFLPLLSTIGLTLGLIFKPNAGSSLETFFLILAGVGWVSALTVSPIKMLKFVFKSIVVGFKTVRGFIPVYGLADLVAAFVGTCGGLFFAVVVLVFLPAVFTITKFFKGEII